MLYRNILAGSLMLGLAGALGCEQTISGLGGKPSPIMPIGESHFMKVLASGNQEQVQLSKVALTRSHNDQIRHFAQEMIDERTDLQSQLQDLATNKEVVLPVVLGNIEQGVVTDLSAQSDTNFDQAYINDEMAALQDTINDTEAESINGADVDVKAFAQRILPKLEHEQVWVKQLKGIEQ